MSLIASKLADHLIKQTIIFESKPEFSDNTKPVYDEMIRRGFDKKYNLVWYISWDKCATIKNNETVYWDPRQRKTIQEKIRNYSYFYKTKCLICCNDFLVSSGPKQFTFGKNQKSFYLSHGTPMKSVKNYYTAPEGIDYAISPAQSINDIMSAEFSISKEKIFATGFPRNDVFSRDVKHINEVCGWDYNKVIVWYPTYRQNKSGGIKLKGDSLPLIHDESNAAKLNETAKKKNVLIIVKPHFAQDVSLIRKMDYSNIRLIDDSFFSDNSITSYEFLAGTDALITDYSSVYFDYTLNDKPIGVIWEDIEEYREIPGFALDLDYYLKGAEKIYKIDELCAFVEEVADNRDRLKAERREIRDIVNISTDGQNAKRAVDFIVEKAQL